MEFVRRRNEASDFSERDWSLCHITANIIYLLCDCKMSLMDSQFPLQGLVKGLWNHLKISGTLDVRNDALSLGPKSSVAVETQ